MSLLQANYQEFRFLKPGQQLQSGTLKKIVRSVGTQIWLQTGFDDNQSILFVSYRSSTYCLLFAGVTQINLIYLFVYLFRGP